MGIRYFLTNSKRQFAGVAAISIEISTMLIFKRSFTEQQITAEDSGSPEEASHASVNRLARSVNETFGLKRKVSWKTDTNVFVTTDRRLLSYA